MPLDHPSMRRRMQRREEMLGVAMASAAAVQPPAQQVNKQSPSPRRAVQRTEVSSCQCRSPNKQQPQQLALRRGNSFDTLAPSFVTSICSEPSVLTDYGLHRAINTPVVVPNEQNPIATIKDRKNARYIENMTARHAVLKRELDESIAAFNEVTASRDDNKNVKLEDMLNHKFLDANNLLARRSREYSAFLRDIKDLQEMPKMGRDELHQRYTVHKAKERFDREDNDSPDVQYQMREIQQQIAGLELEREDLIKRTGAVDALAEQVAYVEHLNKSLRQEHDRMLRHIASKESLCGKHTAAVEQLAEDNAYYENLNARKDRDIVAFAQRNARIGHEKAQLAQDLANSTRACQMMQRDLEIQRNYAADLCKQLAGTHTEIRNFHGQLGFAKSTAMQLKDENRSLLREVHRLNELCDQARDELDDLHAENDRLRVERERMVEIRDLQRENNAHMREEFNEMHGQAVKQVQQAVEIKQEAAELQAELARARAGAARRDSVVSGGILGVRRSASA